jgi:4-amino-4-deoxy-L-arabinose transferase-like glycosyltransferase
VLPFFIFFQRHSVNQPTPAIVAQGAVRRLPRVALLLFCIAYVLPGFFGREPWKEADMTAFGYMAELARGGAHWLAPQLLGLPPAVDALLPYWLGAWAIQLAPSWMASDLAARIPFALLLTLSLFATWYGTYYLARTPDAQPVPFAFGGEALPPDYARAVADGGLLAFIACLGLAQLSHETTPALTQLCFTALSFYALAALPFRTLAPAIGAVLGLAGLALSGAPAMAVMFGSGGALIHLLDPTPEREDMKLRAFWAGGIALLTVLVAVLASWLDLWRWRIELPDASWVEWRSLGRLLLWFTWPAWPLALWTVWRWRHQLVQGGVPSRHLALPLWFAGVAVGATLTTASADRSLLLALPALAALAAFALPTLGRSVAALIDWFTLLFFSGCAIIIWVVWIALQTGVPSQPAANVARLAPGFEHSFSFTPFAMAVAATLAWAWLVKWRTGRHRAAIWKSLVLPAGGAALCWLLLMTLWLPLLDYARSYASLVHRTMAVLKQPSCVEVVGLSRGQIAAFQFHGHLVLQPVSPQVSCPWLLVNKDAEMTSSAIVDISGWRLHSTIRHPIDRDEDVLIYQRWAQALN